MIPRILELPWTGIIVGFAEGRIVLLLAYPVLTALIIFIIKSILYSIKV